MSRREKKNQEKRDAIKTDKALDENKVNCPTCGVSLPASGLAMHMTAVH
jgi:ribosomal protein S27AE